METNFTAEQLKDSANAHSEKILRTCVHCGMCTTTCPTYKILGDELDSPRGRIYLIKDMLENDKPATKEVVKHIDRCLSCLSCMTTCPSGVHYMHLVDHARAYIEKTYDRPWHQKIIRGILAFVLPYPQRFKAAVALSKLGKPFKPLFDAFPLTKPLGAMLNLAPATLSKATPIDVESPEKPKARVALMQGCAQRVLDPEINAATTRLLRRLGIEVITLSEEGCCGALVHHMGKEKASHAQAANNIDAWYGEYEKNGLDAIIITASGCGTTVKDYGHMFREDEAYKEKAATIAGLAKDITEFLDGFGFAPTLAVPDLTIAYHSACSMQHGQKITMAPKNLLKKAGFTVKDVPEGHICCGSAGVYNILQPDIANELRARKVSNIEKVKPDLIATGNLGCMTQIGKGTGLPIVHTVQMLDWATGGPKPAALSHVADAKARALEAAE